MERIYGYPQKTDGLVVFFWSAGYTSGNSPLFSVAHHRIDIWPSFPDHYLAWLFFCLAKSIWYGVEGIRQKNIALTLPACITLVILVMYIALPLTKWSFTINRYVLSSERQHIVRLIQRGKLKASKTLYTQLPYNYRRLSNSGDIIFEKGDPTIVYFPIKSGLLDNHAGILYRSDEYEPSLHDLGGDIINSRQLEKHWWWVRFT